MTTPATTVVSRRPALQARDTDLRMMLVLLLDADSAGVFSSRKIMQRCVTDAAVRVIAGKDIPNFRRIAEFRARHLKHLQPLFLEVLMLCREAGLLKVGRVSLDGTKIKANASRNKTTSHDRMGPKPSDCVTSPLQNRAMYPPVRSTLSA